MLVRVEKSGPVTTILLNRPEVRNAVDRATAEALAAAFDAFERDETALVGVLFGDHGDFCAGADLKAIAQGRPNRAEPKVMLHSGSVASCSPNRSLQRSPVMPSPGASSWRCGAISASSRRMPSLASSTAAGASRCSTAARFVCPG